MFRPASTDIYVFKDWIITVRYAGDFKQGHLANPAVTSGEFSKGTFKYPFVIYQFRFNDNFSTGLNIKPICRLC